jgi:hypothetical protein
MESSFPLYDTVSNVSWAMTIAVNPVTINIVKKNLDKLACSMAIGFKLLRQSYEASLVLLQLLPD